MSIRSQSHYELPSDELAKWLDQQGPDCWWTVDGDPLLTGKMFFPCPSGDLAAVLREIGRPLLILDKNADPHAKGQVITAAELDNLAFRRPLHTDRAFQLCWKHVQPEVDWILAEDTETAQNSLSFSDEEAQ